METLKFRPLSHAGSQLGESPAWSPKENAIWWVDIDGCRLIRTDVSDGKSTVWETPEVVGFVVPTTGPDMLVGMETGLFLFDANTAAFNKCTALNEKGVRFNDATVDAQGRLWAGTMDIDNQRDNGVLYLVGPDLKLREVASGFRTVNGLAVDDARSRIYVSDSNPLVQKVWIADIQKDGHLGSFSTFADFTSFDGRPDGACVDQVGNYWIASVDGGKVLQYAPDGTLWTSHETGMDAPTKPMFYGPLMNQMCLSSKGDAKWQGKLSGADVPVGQPVGEYTAFNLAE